MNTRSTLCAAALLALLAAGARPAGADDAEAPYWPADQEQRLSEVSDEIVAVMREKRQARFENDQAKLKKLDERMKKLDDEKVDLLRAMHQLE